MEPAAIKRRRWNVVEVRRRRDLFLVIEEDGLDALRLGKDRIIAARRTVIGDGLGAV